MGIRRKARKSGRSGPICGRSKGEHPGSGFPRWLKLDLSEPDPMVVLTLSDFAAVAAMPPEDIGLLVLFAAWRAKYPDLPWEASVVCAAPPGARRRMLEETLAACARRNAAV